MLYPILSAAIARNNRDIVLELLRHNADPNGTWYQGGKVDSLVIPIVSQALHEKESLPMLKLLVDSKVNLHWKDSADQTFHHICGIAKLPEATALLLNHNVPSHTRDTLEMTPIEYAALGINHDQFEGLAMACPNALQVKLLLRSGGAPARHDLTEIVTRGQLSNGQAQGSALQNQQEIMRMIEFGLTDEDHAECTRLMVEVSPMQPSIRGNLFNQLRMRECGMRMGAKKSAAKPEKEEDKSPE